MNERLIELVNGELDGTNTPEESAELERTLDTDSSVRTYFEETKSLFGALRDVPDAEPPPGLKHRIMESISREAASAEPPAPRLLSTLKQLFEPVLGRPAWAMSYAFAAGLLVGIGALVLVVNPVSPSTDVVQGTIGQTPSRLIDEATLSAGTVTVELATIDNAGELVLHLRITGSGESTVRIKGTQSDAPTTINAPGPGRFTVHIDRSEQIEIHVWSGGQEASGQLIAAAPGATANE